MDRQDDSLNEPPFAYGGDAAYLEDLYVRYEKDPASVNEDWADFFSGLGEDKETVVDSARGASWKTPNWPIAANGEIVSALDSDWGTIEKAVGNKLKAISLQ